MNKAGGTPQRRLQASAEIQRRDGQDGKIREREILVLMPRNGDNRDDSMADGVQSNLAWIVSSKCYLVGLNNVNDVTNNSKWKNRGVPAYGRIQNNLIN